MPAFSRLRFGTPIGAGLSSERTTERREGVLSEQHRIGHDIVVVGASAGGVEALSRLAASLPADFPAAIFVVLHVSPSGPSVLPNILDRRGPLPAAHAVDGERIEHGRIYVAPPDHHLLVRAGAVWLERGPRENSARPAIDPLFRSAARAYGPRVVGVVLSGVLDDGTAGLSAVKLHGGATIVQDPADALYPAMPRSAIEEVGPDAVLPIGRIGPALVELARRPWERVLQLGGQTIVREDETEREATAAPQPGEPSGFTCPECGGALWETEEGVTRYRCRVGHAFSAESLLGEQSDTVESALWTALRALEERADISGHLAVRLRGRGHPRASAHFEDQAAEALEQAATLRDLLRSYASPAEPGRTPAERGHSASSV